MGYFPSLAADGQRFSYLNPNAGEVLSNRSVNQVWLGDALSGTVAQLSHEPDGIAEQVITGDGDTVFATTNTGRILSIDVAGGTVTQLLDAAPARLALRWPAVPGSYNVLAGTSDASTPVRIGSIPVPVLGAMLRPSEVAIQVPWEAQPDPSASVVVWGTEPAWEQVVGVGVAAMKGNTVTGGIHQDWSRPIDPNDPARPGEVIHMYGTGWGPVDGTVPSGQPTPTDRLYKVTAPCQWRAINQQFIASVEPATVEYPFEVPFSGLATGLVGVYQFDFVIPPDWSYPLFNPICRIGSDYTPLGAVPVAP